MEDQALIAKIEKAIKAEYTNAELAEILNTTMANACGLKRPSYEKAGHRVLRDVLKGCEFVADDGDWALKKLQQKLEPNEKYLVIVKKLSGDSDE